MQKEKFGNINFIHTWKNFLLSNTAHFIDILKKKKKL